MIVPIKKRKLVKIGNSWGFIIPYSYYKNGLLNTNSKYNIDIKQHK